MEIYNKIAKIAKKYCASRVILFGSRGRGDNSVGSDIDIAVYDMPKELQSSFWSELDMLDTLLKIDILHVTKNTDPTLISNIKKDGVILMDRFEDKFSKLKNAVSRLSESISEFHSTKSLTVRDGAIQRFEFCTELAWKTVREKLLDEGLLDVNTPKAVMREAFAVGIISDEKGWLDLISDRNLTSHIYSDEKANEIYNNIEMIYVNLFMKLISNLSSSK